MSEIVEFIYTNIGNHAKLFGILIFDIIIC